jgi:hypothetical protein
MNPVGMPDKVQAKPKSQRNPRLSPITAEAMGLDETHPLHPGYEAALQKRIDAATKGEPLPRNGNGHPNTRAHPNAAGQVVSYADKTLAQLLEEATNRGMFIEEGMEWQEVKWRLENYDHQRNLPPHLTATNGKVGHA